MDKKNRKPQKIRFYKYLRSFFIFSCYCKNEKVGAFNAENKKINITKNILKYK